MFQEVGVPAPLLFSSLGQGDTYTLLEAQFSYGSPLPGESLFCYIAVGRNPLLLCSNRVDHGSNSSLFLFSIPCPPLQFPVFRPVSSFLPSVTPNAPHVSRSPVPSPLRLTRPPSRLSRCPLDRPSRLSRPSVASPALPSPSPPHSSPSPFPLARPPRLSRSPVPLSPAHPSPSPLPLTLASPALPSLASPALPLIRPPHLSRPPRPSRSPVPLATGVFFL